jgi:hypothetical protein
MAAAVLGVGTFTGIAGAQQQQQPTGTREERTTTVTPESRSAEATAATPLALPPGTKAVDRPSTGGMYRSLARATEDAISHNGYEDLVDRFTSEDRDRLSKAAKEEKKDKELNDVVARIEQDWKDKYHGRFSMDADKVFARATVVEGDVEDPRALAAHWPVPATPGMAMQAAAGGQAASNEEALKKGYKVAVVRLSGDGTMAPLDVSLKREWLRWRIDVPDNRTAAQIHDDLVKQLTAFEQNKANWPADENQAYEHATRHVLMAVYGVEGTPMRAG